MVNKIFVASMVCVGVTGVYAHQNVITQSVAEIPDYQIISLSSVENQAPTFTDLCKKVVFTHSGLTCFFKHVYNCDRYAQEVLPIVPCQHLQEFLEHGIKTQQSCMYTKAVFKLFDKKIKITPSISVPGFIVFLRQLPDLVKKDLGDVYDKKNEINKIIRADLENKFHVLKNDPTTFLNDLSQKIVDLDSTTRFVNKDNLCVTITRFIDTCLSKIIWNAGDNDEVWKQFVEIGQELTNLHAKGIIRNVDDLDDCQWGLNARFCFFLSLSGSQLPLSFFEKARGELGRGIKHFDVLVEQEELMTSKTQTLQDAIFASAVKADARQKHGILSEAVIDQ